MENSAVGVRTRKEGDVGQMALENFVAKIKEEINTYAR